MLIYNLKDIKSCIMKKLPIAVNNMNQILEVLQHLEQHNDNNDNFFQDSLDIVKQ